MPVTGLARVGFNGKLETMWGVLTLGRRCGSHARLLGEAGGQVL